MPRSALHDGRDVERAPHAELTPVRRQRFRGRGVKGHLPDPAPDESSRRDLALSMAPARSCARWGNGDTGLGSAARWYTHFADSAGGSLRGGVCGAGARPGLQIRCPALDKSEVGSDSHTLPPAARQTRPATRGDEAQMAKGTKAGRSAAARAGGDGARRRPGTEHVRGREPSGPGQDGRATMSAAGAGTRRAAGSRGRGWLLGAAAVVALAAAVGYVAYTLSRPPGVAMPDQGNLHINLPTSARSSTTPSRRPRGRTCRTSRRGASTPSPSRRSSRSTTSRTAA